MVGGRRLHAKIGRAVVVKGRGTAGRRVRLQVRDHGWHTVGKARIKRDGSFRLRGKLTTALSAPGRVVSAGQKRHIGRVNVYRYAQASWYGPGLYGGHLACGGTLTPGTLGVANKYLPCGSKVTLRKGSRTVRVPVVDRGPYVGGREYDLTAATAQKLGFSGVGAILATS
jgi:rare lipoprotein A (peptidoglycan hydrolase)